jgi:hypothetical protein
VQGLVIYAKLLSEKTSGPPNLSLKNVQEMRLSLHVAAQIDNKQENEISNVQIYPILTSVTANGYKFWSEDQLTRLDSISREEK